MNLADMIQKMVAEVRSSPPKPKAKRTPLTTNEKAAAKAKRLAELLGTEIHGPAPSLPTSPYQDEAVVMFLNTATCTCGAIHQYPSNSLFIKRVRVIKERKSGIRTIPSKVEADYQRIASPNINCAYSDLPRTVEYRTVDVDHCHSCYIPERPPFTPFQVSINLSVPLPTIPTRTLEEILQSC